MKLMQILVAARIAAFLVLYATHGAETPRDQFVILAESRFDDSTAGLDGWSHTNSVSTQNPNEFINYFPSDAVSGGYISCGETAGGNGTVYFVAPAKFGGDQRAAFNGMLTFSLKQSAGDLPSRWYLANDIVLFGPEISIAYRFYFRFPATNWSTFEIPLSESAGWIIAGTNRLATADDMLKTLSEVKALWIRAEWTDHNADKSDLDNVVLLGRPSSVSNSLTVNVHAAVTIEGLVGRTYRIDFRDALGATDNWIPLTNVVLPSSPWRIDDPQPVFGNRFYRAILLD